MVLKPNAVVDIAKPGPQLQNLTGMWNARVLDGFTPFVVQFKENGLPVNLTGLNAFIEGDIGEGHYDSATDDIVMTGTPKSVRYTDDGSGNTNMGIVVFRLPPQFFIQTGIFKGFIGLQSSTGIRSTSNDVWFKVLGSSYTMGISYKYFISDFQKALDQANGKVEQALNDLYNKYNQKVGQAESNFNNVLSTIKTLQATQQNLDNQLTNIKDQIQDNNIVTTQQHQEDISKISTAINDRLKDMKTAPVGVADEKTLKNTYPNGADGLFVTLDTKHLYMWLNGQWSDAGPYESAQLDKQVEQSIGDVKSVVLKENLIKNGSFSDGTLNGVWGDLGSDKLHIFGFLNRNWACLQTDTNEAYHGMNWWIDNPLKNLGQNYPFHIEFDIVTAQPMVLNVNFVPIDHQNNRLGGMTIKTIATNSWEIKHFSVDFTVDDKFVNTDHFYFQVVQNDGKPVQEMRVTGVVCYLKYHQIILDKGNLIENGDFSTSSPYPTSSNLGNGTLSVFNFANQNWLEFQSSEVRTNQGVAIEVSNPIKDLGQNYPLKLKLKLATSSDTTIDINLIGINVKGERMGGQKLKEISTQSWRFIEQEINFEIAADYINADHFVLQILQPDNAAIEHLRLTDLDLRVMYDQTQDTQGNLIADSTMSNGVVDSQVSSNTGDGSLSVIEFENHNWLSFTSDKPTTYQGLSWHCSNPIKELGQNYPLRINFTMMTAERMTLQADIIGYDTQGKQVGSILLNRFDTKAWRSVTYNFTADLSGNLSNADQLYLQIVQPDGKTVKEIRVTDIIFDLIYDNYSITKNNLIQNGNFANGTTQPAYGDLGSDQLSIINYIGNNWLKVTNTTNAQWGGPQWEIISDQSYFDAPLKIQFDLMTAEDMTLNLNAVFFDDKGQRMGGNAGGQIIDQIKTDASQIIHYSNRFKLNSNYRNANLIHIQLLNYEQKPIKQLIITNVSLKSKFDDLKIDTVPTIDELEQQYGLPIMCVTGDTSGMDHDHAKNITYEFKNRNTHLKGYGTLKWQGSSSATLAKKGYRLKTTKSDYSKKDKIRVQPSWQKHHKFNLKAYYNDGLLSRDPIAANIGAQVSASRPTLPRDLIKEDNFGYIDGFPIILVINNEYQGIYSFNLPRPDFSYTKWAIIGNQYNDICQFIKVPDTGVKLDESDFLSLNPEDKPTDEERKAVTDLLNWCINSDDDEFKRDLDKHFNIPSLIDYVVIANILGARDASGKNQVLMTWDGKIWYYQLYDLDCTYNANWMGGKTFETPKVGVDLPFLGNNKFLTRFARLYHNAIADRYRDVRQWCTPGYILDKYKQRINLIGQGNFDEEWAKWNDPSKDTEDFKQLQNDLYDHFKAADYVWLGNNPENTTYQIKPDTPPAQVQTTTDKPATPDPKDNKSTDTTTTDGK